MRVEEITSCKRHIASVSLTDWCMIIYSKPNIMLNSFTSFLLFLTKMLYMYNDACVFVYHDNEHITHCLFMLKFDWAKTLQLFIKCVTCNYGQVYVYIYASSYAY